MSNRALPSGMPVRPALVSDVALRFLAWASLVLAVDLGSKHWAVTSLADRAIQLVDRFSLFLVFNTGTAGGFSIGPYTWLINVLGTVATVALVVGVVVPLARVDLRAVAAMGLIAGGATGNLASLVGDSRGVPDFLALHVGEAYVVFNVADIGLWIGAGLLVPVAMGLVRQARAERAMARTSADEARAAQPSR